MLSATEVTRRYLLLPMVGFFSSPEDLRNRLINLNDDDGEVSVARLPTPQRHHYISGVENILAPITVRVCGNSMQSYALLCVVVSQSPMLKCVVATCLSRGHKLLCSEPIGFAANVRLNPYLISRRWGATSTPWPSRLSAAVCLIRRVYAQGTRGNSSRVTLGSSVVCFCPLG